MTACWNRRAGDIAALACRDDGLRLGHEPIETAGRAGRQQRLLVGEMPIGRAARHADTMRDRTQGHGATTALVQQIEGGLHAGIGQIAVVIAITVTKRPGTHDERLAQC